MLWLNNLFASIFMYVVRFYTSFHIHGTVDVTIDKGILRGSVASTWSGTRYFSFKGIPYAKPPIGELRFKAPQEETPWDGVRNAVNHGAICPQMELTYYIFGGSEDCLFLNVYTPSLQENERLPVLVYIHGGKFKFLSGNDDYWGPEYFVENGVILVTINYRLGPLGFLTTEDDDVPGNAGMKDQVASLRWIQRNIAKFGGDPGRVTIFGTSSAAVCVQYILLSPMASGLFTGAIAHSGSALQDWSLTENGTSSMIRLAGAMGAKEINGDKAKALQFLKTASPEDMIWAHDNMATQADLIKHIEIFFLPSIEKNVTSEEVFLPDSALNILKSGNFNKVPLITGYLNSEGWFLFEEVENPKTWKAVIKSPQLYLPNGIKNKRRRIDVGKSMRKFYFDDKTITRENISNLADLFSDLYFVTGVKRATKLQLRTSRSPIYFFVFSYGGGLNTFKYGSNVKDPGAIHGDELGYLFFHRIFFWRKPVVRSEDEYVHKTMIRLWTNFVKYGNPTPPGDSLTWKPATVDQFNYLNISGYNTEPEVNPDPERTNFWSNVYKNDDEL